SVIAGTGNIYRAEVLFRLGIDPLTPGRSLGRERAEAIWQDTVELMRIGRQRGRIDTVRPEHDPEAMGRPPRKDDHGGEVYVYRRQNQPWWICGGPILTNTIAGRNLFWCPVCQAAWAGIFLHPNLKPARSPSEEGESLWSAPSRPQALCRGA